MIEKKKDANAYLFTYMSSYLFHSFHYPGVVCPLGKMKPWVPGNLLRDRKAPGFPPHYTWRGKALKPPPEHGQLFVCLKQLFNDNVNIRHASNIVNTKMFLKVVFTSFEWDLQEINSLVKNVINLDIYSYQALCHEPHHLSNCHRFDRNVINCGLIQAWLTSQRQ